MGVSDQTLRMALWIIYQLAVLSFAALSSSQNASFSVKDGNPVVLQILLCEQKSMIIGVRKGICICNKMLKERKSCTDNYCLDEQRISESRKRKCLDHPKLPTPHVTARLHLLC